MKSKKMKEIETKFNMDYKDLLEKLYIEEKKSLPAISKILGYDAGMLSRHLKKFNIPARGNKEAFKNWFETSDTTKFMDNAKNIAKTHLNSKPARDKLREVMQTKEYRRKCSKVKIGSKNPMYKNNLTDEHRVNKRLLPNYKQWSKDVRERDHYTCKACGATGDNLLAHHIEDYFTCEEKRLDINNGVTLCTPCHNRFHAKYGFRGTKKEMLDEFLKGLK